MFVRAPHSDPRKYLSEMVPVWSKVVPRVTWQGARDVVVVERDRRTLNTRMSRFVCSRAGVVMSCGEVADGDNRRLMHVDGVHLNKIGLDILLSGLQDRVKQALFLLGGGWSPM